MNWHGFGNKEPSFALPGVPTSLIIARQKIFQGKRPSVKRLGMDISFAMVTDGQQQPFLQASKFLMVLSEEVSLCQLVKSKHCLVCIKADCGELVKSLDEL